MTSAHTPSTAKATQAVEQLRRRVQQQQQDEHYTARFALAQAQLVQTQQRASVSRPSPLRLALCTC
jgi:hypothetical protein